MLILEKRVGETPLELLERARKERPDLAMAKLSYAGRLDPMAEGLMVVLVGDEENRPENRQKFLACDKEYVATFLVGVKTDSGDALGIPEWPLSKMESIYPSEDDIKKQVEGLLGVKRQKYPWFSGRAVNGIKLFEHFKKGNTGIERPSRDVSIKEVEFMGVERLAVEEVKKHIFDSIGKVGGDFRQEKILSHWRDFFEFTQHAGDKEALEFRVRFLVSSGTFIRALTENFGFPVTLLALRRTKILM
jgi:tRNA pseudouridine(55) synthase